MIRNIQRLTMGSKQSALTRRDAIKTAVAAATVSVTGGTFLSIGGCTDAGLTKVRLQFDWLMSNGQVGDIVAAEQGFFAEEGLDVTFGPGGPNAQTAAEVISGHSDFGQFSTSMQVLSAYGSGRPIKMFACGYQTYPYAYFSLPSAPIRSPKDFVGKTIAVNPNGRFGLGIIMTLHDIDPDSVRVVTMGAGMQPLITGQVDAVTAFTTNVKALSVLGPDRIEMTAEQAGLQGYANAYFTTIDSYDDQKPILIRFIRAVARGWGWSYVNRKAAVEIMCKAYPNLDREIEYSAIDTVMDISFNQETKDHGWGSFTNERMQQQVEQFASAAAFRVRIPEVSQCTTDEILELTAADRPKFG